MWRGGSGSPHSMQLSSGVLVPGGTVRVCMAATFARKVRCLLCTGRPRCFTRRGNVKEGALAPSSSTSVAALLTLEGCAVGCPLRRARPTGFGLPTTWTVLPS